MLPEGPLRAVRVVVWLEDSLYQRKVLPAMGLVHFPFLAAFISAYNAGFIPFFLHFFISASVRLVVSKSLALHSLLEPDRLRSTSKSPEPWGRSEGRDWLEANRLERCDVRSNETFRSIISRSGTPVGPFGLRIIFRNMAFGECGSASMEAVGVFGGLNECLELTSEERIDESKEYASEATGVVAGSSSSVKKYGDGAVASGGSGSSSSELQDWVVVTESIVSRDVRRRRCKGRRLLLR